MSVYVSVPSRVIIDFAQTIGVYAFWHTIYYIFCQILNLGVPKNPVCGSKVTKGAFLHTLFVFSLYCYSNLQSPKVKSIDYKKINSEKEWKVSDVVILAHATGDR